MPFDSPGTTARPAGLSRAGRYRAADGTFLPSVTEILNVIAKPDLIPWANRLGKQGIDYDAHLQELARAGTLTHAKIEAALRGKPEPDASTYTAEEQRHSFASFFHWIAWSKTHTIRVLTLERQYVSTIHAYGGTIDAVLEIDGETVICDWKSSVKPYQSHFLQLAAY